MRQNYADRAEVLAPAGSIQSLHAALAAGADAVYMGGSRFGARAYAENPEEKEFLEAIDFCHLHGRRLYLTLNTLLKPREIERDLYAYVEPMYRQGLDGVIVQDFGVLRFLRQEFPGLPLHASTQMTITGPEGARAAKDMGCSRIVPARELSLAEIRQIKEETGIELEVFVHGALCYCYSGQCLMSSLIGGRSGNRGRCAGTCRLPFTVPPKDREEINALSLKDLCALPFLPDLLDAGVYSFKIEGRMKSPLYAAGITEIYRKYTDLYLEEGREGFRIDPRDLEQLRQIYDRGGFTNRYFTAKNGRDMMAFAEKTKFREVPPELVKRLKESYVEADWKEKISGECVCLSGEVIRARATYTLKDGDAIEVSAEGNVADAAKNRAVTEEEIRRPFEKTGDTPFEWEALTIQTDGKSFVPMGAVKELRRELLEKMREALVLPYRRTEQEEGAAIQGESAALQGEGTAIQGKERREQALQFLVYVEQPGQLNAALRCPEVTGIILDSEAVPAAEWRTFLDNCHKAQKQGFLAFPYIFRIQSRVEWKERAAELKKLSPDGFLVRNVDEARFMREQGLPGRMLAESSLYAYNSLAREEARDVFAPDLFMAPLEEKEGELAALNLNEECLLIYGYLPMMVTANCVQNNFGGCKKTPGYRFLGDRMGENFPVACRCHSCCNVIFNSRPFSLLGCQKEVQALVPAAIRMNFTVESEQETEALLKEYAGVFARGEQDHAPTGSFTRGHFKRGVQ